MNRPSELLLDWPTQIASTAAGPVEYARIDADGPVILSIHGGPGGADQGLLLADPFRRAGFSILAPSRPGYLRTPLESGATIDEQADLCAMLLDALAIPAAIVFGVSAGGPAAYRFAARHPDRTSAMVAVGAVSRRYRLHVSHAEEAIFLSRFGLWLTNFVFDHFPRTFIKQLLATEGELTPSEVAERASHIITDPYKLNWLHGLIETLMPKGPLQRRIGLDNDLAQFAALDRLDLKGITAPTLVVHGQSDRDVPPEHAQYALSQIAHAEALWIPRGDHLALITSDESAAVQSQIIDWMRRTASRTR